MEKKVTDQGREMQRVLGEWEGSKLSLAEFARRRGLAVQTLRWWRHRLRERGSQPEIPW